jgi:hypothetical protein
MSFAPPCLINFMTSTIHNCISVRVSVLHYLVSFSLVIALLVSTTFFMPTDPMEFPLLSEFPSCTAGGLTRNTLAMLPLFLPPIAAKLSLAIKTALQTLCLSPPCHPAALQRFA